MIVVIIFDSNVNELNNMVKDMSTEASAKKLPQKGRVDSIDQLVSKRLRKRRVMLGLSQQELGEAVDVSIQQVQKYEKATNRIASGKLYSFSKFLNVPVSYFFDDNEGGSNSSMLLNTSGNDIDDEYNRDSNLGEREVISLVKAFSEVQDTKVRKKIIELVRSMSNPVS